MLIRTVLTELAIASARLPIPTAGAAKCSIEFCPTWLRIRRRSILVLPAATASPANHSSCLGRLALIGQRLVAPVGTAFRSTRSIAMATAWPVRELSIPLVLFAHQKSVVWTSGDGPADTDYSPAQQHR